MMCSWLPALVKVARPYGRTFVSTTGHGTKCNVEELVQTAPDVLIVATSGMSQEVYQTTHTAGQVRKFFDLCHQLKELRAKNVTVCYHRYNNNLQEEPAARAFARECGFHFTGLWANHMPVEDLIAGRGNDYLVVPVPDRVALGRSEQDYICGFQTSELAFDALGNVTGCSVAHARDLMGNVLELPLSEILARKKRYSLCDSCYRTGAYKQACGLSIDTDRESARRSGAGPLLQFRYWTERTRKRFWRDRELRKVKGERAGAAAASFESAQAEKESDTCATV